MIDLTQKIYDKDGKVSITTGKRPAMNDEGMEIYQYETTVKSLLITCLLASVDEPTIQDDFDDIEVTDKANSAKVDQVKERYDLFMKIRDVEEVEFTDSEIELLCRLIVQKSGVLFAGQIINHLKK